MKKYILVSLIFLTINLKSIEPLEFLSSVKSMPEFEAMLIFDGLPLVDQEIIADVIMNKYEKEIIQVIENQIFSFGNLHFMSKHFKNNDVPVNFVNILIQSLRNQNLRIKSRYSYLAKKVRDNFSEELNEALRDMNSNKDFYYNILKEHIAKNNLRSIKYLFQKKKLMKNLKDILNKLDYSSLPNICTTGSVCEKALIDYLLFKEEEDELVF